MNTEIYSLDESPARAAYSDLWERSPQRTPFAHLAFADAACAAFGLRGRIAAAADDAGAWRGAVLLFERRAGPLRVAAVPPLAPYSGPILDGVLDEAEAHGGRSALGALAAEVARYHQSTWLLPPAHTDARPLAWAGWTLATRYTYVSELPVDPDHWSTNLKRTLKKSEADYSVDEDSRHIAAAARLMRGALERAGRRFRVTDDTTARIAGAMVDAGLARVFGAVAVGGTEAEAALVAAHDGRTAYYWIVGGEPGPATTLLLAHALPALAAGGVAAFDWCGANLASVAEFKRKFGPTLVQVVRARQAAPGPLRLLSRLRGG